MQPISKTIVLEGCISQYTRLLYWRNASHNTLDYCIGGIYLTIHYSIVLEGCISQYTGLLYWRDASHNTLDYCIEGMHLTIH